jgi:hypothetical protein
MWAKGDSSTPQVGEREYELIVWRNDISKVGIWEPGLI